MTAGRVSKLVSGSSSGWALLVAGVAALAAMAWHLLRQLKDGTSAPPPP